MSSFPEHIRCHQRARVPEVDSGASRQELPLYRESPVELQYNPRPAELAGVGTVFPAELPSHPQPSHLEPPDQCQSPVTTKTSLEAGDYFLEEQLGARSFDNSSPYRSNHSTSVQGPMMETSRDDMQFHSDLIQFMPSATYPGATGTFDPDYGMRQKCHRHPTLTLDTGIQGEYPSSQESRQSSLQGSTPSQYSGTTLLSESLSSTQSSIPTHVSSNLSGWLSSSSMSFPYTEDDWQRQNSSHPQENNDLVYASAGPGSSTSHVLNLFANSFHLPGNSTFNMGLSQDPEISIFSPEPPLSALSLQNGLEFPIPLPLNPKVPPASAPPAQTTHHPPPRDEAGHPPTPNPPMSAVPKDICPKCRLRFTSKPRDLGRNLKRHLTLSCPWRETLVPRLKCSSTHCNKTFARDCARRTHEKNYHADEGLPRPRGWGRGVEKGRRMKRAISSLN